ncbi:MAG: hypothetical protein R2851_07265 [Caldilineaceae bacterium]
MGTIMIPVSALCWPSPATVTVLGSTALGAGVGAPQASFLGMLVVGVAEETRSAITGVRQGELLLVVHGRGRHSPGRREWRTNHGTDVDVRVAPTRPPPMRSYRVNVKSESKEARLLPKSGFFLVQTTNGTSRPPRRRRAWPPAPWA